LRDEVAHGAGRDEERGFLAEEHGCAALQQIDGGILVVEILTDDCFRNRTAHDRRRLRNRVTPQVDYVVRRNQDFSLYGSV
jgi:hypothetical protein